MAKKTTTAKTAKNQTAPKPAISTETKKALATAMSTDERITTQLYAFTPEAFAALVSAYPISLYKSGRMIFERRFKEFKAAGKMPDATAMKTALENTANNKGDIILAAHASAEKRIASGNGAAISFEIISGDISKAL